MNFIFFIFAIKFLIISQFSFIVKKLKTISWKWLLSSSYTDNYAKNSQILFKNRNKLRSTYFDFKRVTSEIDYFITYLSVKNVKQTKTVFLVGNKSDW